MVKVEAYFSYFSRLEKKIYTAKFAILIMPVELDAFDIVLAKHMLKKPDTFNIVSLCTRTKRT